MNKDDNERLPLTDEAAKRETWRGGETRLDPDTAEGHTLPESERDRAVMRGGSSGSTIAPPD